MSHFPPKQNYRSCLKPKFDKSINQWVLDYRAGFSLELAWALGHGIGIEIWTELLK